MFSNGLPEILPATHAAIPTSGNPGPMLGHGQVRITALILGDLSGLRSSANHPIARVSAQGAPAGW